jgi:hypothetical protein
MGKSNNRQTGLACFFQHVVFFIRVNPCDPWFKTVFRVKHETVWPQKGSEGAKGGRNLRIGEGPNPASAHMEDTKRTK